MTALVTAIGGTGHGRASLRSATVGQEPLFGSDADTSPKQTFMECQLNPIEQLQRNAKAPAGRDVLVQMKYCRTRSRRFNLSEIIMS